MRFLVAFVIVLKLMLLSIGRGIHSSLSGEESIRVARVDISLGQTERLLIAYDRAYLHFFLAFRSRAIILGPCHVRQPLEVCFFCNSSAHRLKRHVLINCSTPSDMPILTVSSLLLNFLIESTSLAGFRSWIMHPLKAVTRMCSWWCPLC